MLDGIHAHMLDSGMRASTITSGSTLALINAVTAWFPSIIGICCWFHHKPPSEPSCSTRPLAKRWRTRAGCAANHPPERLSRDARRATRRTTRPRRSSTASRW
jgi:hypothetical protein